MLRSPSSYTEEIARYLFIWVGLLGASYAAGKRLHLAIDLLPTRLEGASKRALSLFIESCAFLFALLVLVVVGGRLVRLTLILGQHSAALQVPLGYVYLALPLSGLLIMFHSALSAVEEIRKLQRRRNRRSEEAGDGVVERPRPGGDVRGAAASGGTGGVDRREAAAVAVLYSAILAFLYREVKVKDLPQILLDTAAPTAVVMLLIGTSMAMSWLLSYENIPQNLSAALLALTDEKIVILLIINFILLAVGTFMDMTPAVLIFTPIFLAVVTQLGIDPTHFGIILVLNLCIGLCTPPVGSVLFVGCGVAQTSITRVIRPLLPLYVGMIVALLIVTFVPWLSLWLPGVFGY